MAANRRAKVLLPPYKAVVHFAKYASASTYSARGVNTTLQPNKKRNIFILIITVLYAGAVEIQPFWTNVSGVSSTLTIDGKTADCSAKISALSGTTSIKATMTLYRQVGSAWYSVKSWTKTVSSASVTLSEEYTVTSGYYYKLAISADVTRSGTTETVSATSASKYCG